MKNADGEKICEDCGQPWDGPRKPFCKQNHFDTRRLSYAELREIIREVVLDVIAETREEK